jgi:hypothetical protein
VLDGQFVAVVPPPESSDGAGPESSEGDPESSPVPLGESSFVFGCPESSLGVGLPVGPLPESSELPLPCGWVFPVPESFPVVLVVLDVPVVAGIVPSEPAAHAPNENAAVTASALNHILRMREK